MWPAPSQPETPKKTLIWVFVIENMHQKWAVLNSWTNFVWDVERGRRKEPLNIHKSINKKHF